MMNRSTSMWALKAQGGALVGAAAAWLVSGCGNADAVENTEPAGVVTEAAVSARSIAPVAAAIQFTGGEFGTPEFWVFACDSQHHLKRAASYDGGAFGPWKTLDNGCQDGLAVGNWWQGGDLTIIVYMRGTDDKLWQLRYVRRGVTSPWDDADWADISADSGIGLISGAPRFISYDSDDTFGYVNLAVTNDLNSLYVVGSDGFTWNYQKVYRSSTSHTAVTTSYPVATTTQGYHEHPRRQFIAGRGISSSDIGTSWIAKQNAGRWEVVDSWTGSSDIPTYTGDSIARFGSTLKIHDAPNSASWTPLNGCDDVVGAPQVTDGQWFGLASSSSRELIDWDAVSQGVPPVDLCYGSLGGAVDSALYQFTYKAHGQLSYDNALYKGTNGHLWIYWQGVHTDMGLTLL